MSNIGLLQEEKHELVHGDWYRIGWCPDFTTNEKLNLGIAIKTSSGKIELAFLENFERLKCLFGEDAEWHAKFISKMATEYLHATLRNPENIMQPPSDQLIVEPMGYAQAHTLEELKSILFRNAVSLARPVRSQKGNRFRPVSKETFVAELLEYLPAKLELEYSLYFPENPDVSLDGGHNAYIPIHHNDVAATITSAAFSDIYRVKSHLHDAFDDLLLARDKIKFKQCSVIYRLNSGGLSEKNKDLINGFIDKFEMTAKSEQIHVISGTEAELVAEDVASWIKKIA